MAMYFEGKMCSAGWTNHRLELAGQTECPPTQQRWMATVFAGSEDRVANRSRIVSKLQLYDLPLSLPTQFSQLKVSTQGRIVKQFQLYDLLLCFQTQFLHLRVCIQDRIVKLEF